MNESLAPVILFVYNRLEHTEKTIEALKENTLARESELFIFSDGPKKETDIQKVNAVREYIKQVEGFKEIHVMERKKNYGLAKSIIEGVSEIIKKYKKVIVLEDDLITDINFLTYMNAGLEQYAKEKQVYSVTGYSYTKEAISAQPYFLKLCSSWSWGTWEDRWEQFDAACNNWDTLKNSRSLRRQFDYDFSYPFYNLLKRQLADEKTNSWAIVWYWTIFKNRGLTLYPPIALVDNNGFDGSGEHCGNQKGMRNNLSNDILSYEWEYEQDLTEKKSLRKKVVQAIRKQAGPGGRIEIIKDILG